MSLTLVTLARYAGWTALSLLLLTLCATPVSRVLARVRPAYAPRIPRWRRRLGILSAVFALGHATFALFALDVTLALVWSWPHLRAGLLSLGVLSALLVTSYPRVVRATRFGAWKALHRLVYVAAALALLHVLLAPFAQVGLVLTVFGLTAAVGMLRLLPP